MTFRLTGSIRWFPFTDTSSSVEFRIVSNIFCEVYNIQRDSIQFDDYVKMCWQHYLLQLITIAPTSWLFVIVLVCINWIRVSTISIGQCDNLSPGIEEENCLRRKNEDDMKIFIYVGVLVFVFSVVMSVISR